MTRGSIYRVSQGQAGPGTHLRWPVSRATRSRQQPICPYWPPMPVKSPRATEPSGKGKGPVNEKPPPPPPKEAEEGGGVSWFNTSGGCRYGEECRFTHWCNNCGALDSHTTARCPYPKKPYGNQN